MALIPLEPMISCCFKSDADENSMADIFRYGLSQWNNEVYSRKNTLFRTLHTLEIKAAGYFTCCFMDKSQIMSNYMCPLSIWNLRCLPVVARNVYLMSSKALRWNQKSCFVNVSIVRVPFLVHPTPLKSNLGHKKITQLKSPKTTKPPFLGFHVI